MQALERAAAMFCVACLCAELVSRLVGQGWGQRCIKTAAGLYILVVLAQALPGAKAQLRLSALPQPEPAALGSREEAILSQAEQALAAALAEQYLQETGLCAELDITLVQTDAGVKAGTVRIRLPENTPAAGKQKLTELLTAQLRVEPESLVWEGGP